MPASISCGRATKIVAKNGRSRMAHPNVERVDLKNDPVLPELRATARQRSYAAGGNPADRHIHDDIVADADVHRAVASAGQGIDLQTPTVSWSPNMDSGICAANQSIALDVTELAAEKLAGEYGHVELVYDFDAGDEADGWLHALFRYGDRASGHHAETSFGSHMFNTALTYRGEPQSYSGPAPGLSTRLFLRVAPRRTETICHLIYPVSEKWHPQLDDQRSRCASENGEELARKDIAIPRVGLVPLACRRDVRCGAAARGRPASLCHHPRRDLPAVRLSRRSMGTGGSFSLDHMFGF